MIVDYEPAHFLKIRFQKWQGSYGSPSEAHAAALAEGWCAYTAFAAGDATQPLICAGIQEVWPGRAMAWAAFDFDAKPVMVEAHRKTLAVLDACPYTRVEMYVRPGFDAGWRWSRMLGFTFESLMRRGAPDGGDILVMTRFKRSRAVKDLTCNSRSWPSPQLRQSAP